MTANSILTKADTFYQVKVQNNTWCEFSKEEEKLVSMEATFKDLNLRLEQANKKAKRRQSSANESSRDGNKNQSSKNVPKWKLENPKKEKKLKKQGKTYYWCPRHNNDKGMWVLHKPDQCRNKPRSTKATAEKKENKDERDDSNQEQAMPVIEERDDKSSIIKLRKICMTYVMALCAVVQSVVVLV